MFLNKAYLIDPTYVFNYAQGVIDSNVDSNSINTFILMSQDLQTQSILGSHFYRQILADVTAEQNDGTPLPSGIQLLLEQNIQPALLWWTLYNAYPFLYIRATNKSIVQKHSDDSNSISLAQLDVLRQPLRANAQFADERIEEEILNNTQYYQSYYQTTGILRIQPKAMPYYGGLYLNRYLKSSIVNRGGVCPGCFGDGRGTQQNW